MSLSYFARKILRLLGWRIEWCLPPEVKRGVVVFAPHTSNWDAVYGLLMLKAIGIPYRFAIKREALLFPLGLVLKRLGAVPVERKKKRTQHTGAAQNMVALLQQPEDVFLVIAPEGTRKHVSRWRSGFYHIAQKAQVPIVPVYLDYEKKVGGSGDIYYPPHKTFDELVKELHVFYSTKQGKYPEAGVRNVEESNT